LRRRRDGGDRDATAGDRPTQTEDSRDRLFLLSGIRARMPVLEMETSSRVGCVTSGSGLVVSSAQRLLWHRPYGELVYALRNRGAEEAWPVGSTSAEPK